MVSDYKCGTLADPNYRAAFNALENAINFCFDGRLEKPCFFPKAGDSIIDESGDSVFYYEGSLSWKSEVSSYLGLEDVILCKRVMQKASEVDIPICTLQDETQTFFYPSSPVFSGEERIFNLRKDYSALLSVFNTLQQDLAFICENNKAFLFRRLHDREQYYKPRLLFGYVSLKPKDLKESIHYYENQYKKNNQRIEQYQEEATAYCKRSLDYCIAHHDNPLAYINRGLFDYLDGNVVDAVDRINTALKKAKTEDLEALKDNALLLKGRSELEAGLYADAILTLTELIYKAPGNKDAYFDRAGAYFELGNFDLSLEDYLTSGIKPEPISKDSIEMVAFSLGLAKGVLEGGAQAGVEFIPSLLSSLQGIGHGLWAFALDPVEISVAFVQATQSCIDFIKTHAPQELLMQLVPELQELLEKWDTLEDKNRGEITGNIIGKYGVDIFAGAGIAKGMKLYRDLKRANNLLTFEAMAISERNRELIKLESARKAHARKEILQHSNLKIHPGRQGKHIEGHNNFELNRSILTHPDPQNLVNNFCGKGIKSGNKLPGTSGYQEIVDFGEFIGYSVRLETGEKVATSWGKIHYSKDGVHIVPTEPRW